MLQMGWDTGTPVMMISRSTANAAKVATGVDKTEFNGFAVGGKEFGPQHIEIWNIPLPREIAGLIGYPFFREHIVCFDYPRLMMRVE